MRRCARAALVALALAVPTQAQEVDETPPATREEAIAEQRAEKVAQLWPERQSPMVQVVNTLAERGLREGIDSGQGANGLQLVLGGMRTGQGFTAGLGYRRSDLWQERIGYRATARGTLNTAYMLDFELDFQGLRTEGTTFRWYSKIEHSPQIDFYGLGSQSLEGNRTSFLYRDISSDLDATYQPHRRVRLGVTGGYLHAHADRAENDLPPIDEVFPQVRGTTQNTQYTRIGAFVSYDTRDSRTGPRSGQLAAFRFREYWDIDRRQFAFRQTEMEFQQYLPYFSRSRVVALRASMVLSFPKEGNETPVYLQPTIGGNDDLRGFERYRFRDNHALSLGAEHRWHVFSMLDMAVFADAGKVVPLKRDVTPNRLRYNGGLGFRVRLGRAVVTRIDLAASDEGFRWMWTFSDNYSAKW